MSICMCVCVCSGAQITRLMLVSTMNKNKPRKVDRNSSGGYFDVKWGVIKEVLRERVDSEQSPESDEEMRGKRHGQTRGGGQEGNRQKKQRLGPDTAICLVCRTTNEGPAEAGESGMVGRGGQTGPSGPFCKHFGFFSE